MDWMLEYVGKPYVPQGRDPETGLDCFALVVQVMRRAGVDVDYNPLTWRRHTRAFEYPCRIQRYDVLCFCQHHPELVDHVGVAVNAGDFIHAWQQAEQVVCESISRRRMAIKRVVRPMKYDH